MRSLGYSQPLYLLAFDHRSSFTKDLLGLTGKPTPDEVARVSAAKTIIFDGFLRARENGAPADASGILVDEQFGAEIARRAHEVDVILAMPAEASGQKLFTFEYGDDFGAHIERFAPTFVKVLVRYNPDDPDRDGNATQAARLRRLSDWTRDHDQRFLFELLVPATPDQLAAVGGDGDRYDAELRPDLMARAIAELQGAGVEPDIWKIEGLETRADCERVAAQARAGGRDAVACIVLGRGANEERVERWLRVAAPVEGFRGLAIGRTMWQSALEDWRDGKVDAAGAADRIAGRYLRAIEVYTTAARE